LEDNASPYNNLDIYNRKQKVEYWKHRIDTDLVGSDKQDVLKLVNFMEDKERASLWIIRCITAMLLVRRQLRKPFKDVSRDDIRTFLKWMELKNYKASTNEKFRQILKLFYKIVYGNEVSYPEPVNWFSVKLSREKIGKITSNDLAEYLDEKEVKKLIETAPTIQKKAFLACMYESGARPEEFLNLTNTDIKIDEDGAIFILRGKTGERRVRIVSFVVLLQAWLGIHPLAKEKVFPLWISESTNYKNRQLGLRGAEKIIEQTLPKAGLVNKHARLYILRHLRATFLSTRFKEAQMCKFFGWVLGSRVVSRYIHLSGADIDSTLIAISKGESSNKKENKDDSILQSLQCVRCSATLDPTSNYCGRCALPLNLSEQYLKRHAAEEENNDLRRQIEDLRNEIGQKLTMVMRVVHSNPQLVNIKPEAILDRLTEELT
jgi:integrase/recombinase XerD